MPVVSQRERLEALRRLGISEAVIELAAGKNRRAAFEYECSEPYMIYGCMVVPAGDPLVPLWEDRCGGVTAVRPGQIGLEFVEFSVEAPEDYRIVAKSEQGLLAHLFLILYEGSDAPPKEAALPQDAASVGFQYYADLVSAYSAHEHRNFEQHEAFVRAFVNGIDRRAIGNASA
jgi:hypothetical protein